MSRIKEVAQIALASIVVAAVFGIAFGGLFFLMGRGGVAR